MSNTSRPRLFLVGAQDDQRETGGPAPGEAVDRELLQRARAGDVQAWEQLVDRHVADVWTWAVEATGSQAEGELVSRLVWLRLAQALPWDEVDPVAPWLRRTVEEQVARRPALGAAHATLRAVGSQRTAADPRPGT